MQTRSLQIFPPNSQNVVREHQRPQGARYRPERAQDRDAAVQIPQRHQKPRWKSKRKQEQVSSNEIDKTRNFAKLATDSSHLSHPRPQQDFHEDASLPGPAKDLVPPHDVATARHNEHACDKPKSTQELAQNHLYTETHVQRRNVPDPTIHAAFLKV